MRPSAMMLLIFGVLAAAGCNEPMDFLVVGDEPIVVDATPIEIVRDHCSRYGLFQLELDQVTIRQIEISGDLLTITVAYRGGCADHAFTLHATRCFLESWPLQSEIMLVHDDPDDPCDAIVTDEVVFYLAPLKEICLEMYPRHGCQPLKLNVYESGNPPHYSPQPLYDMGSE